MLSRTFSYEQIQKDFSKVAWFYDIWGKLTETKSIAESIKLSGLINNMNVLDIGVGTGQLFKKIIEINSDGFNSGIDLSSAMLKKAIEKTNNKINALFVNGNAYRLPYKDKQFDFLFSSYVLDLLPETDYQIIFSEFKRVMKENGTGIIITMTMGKRWYHQFWYMIAKYFPSLLTNCRPVQLSEYLLTAQFKITDRKFISQNTFPSEIIKFRY
jgi:ubiquinone/menaquinone biosynthesis C-methylase UbiE